MESWIVVLVSSLRALPYGDQGGLLAALNEKVLGPESEAADGAMKAAASSKAQTKMSEAAPANEATRPTLAGVPRKLRRTATQLIQGLLNCQCGCCCGEIATVLWSDGGFTCGYCEAHAAIGEIVFLEV